MTIAEDRGSRALTLAHAALQDAREARAHVVREREVLRQQNDERLARSREQLRVTSDLLRELARQRAAGGGRYRT